MKVNSIGKKWVMFDLEWLETNLRKRKPEFYKLSYQRYIPGQAL